MKRLTCRQIIVTVILLYLFISLAFHFTLIRTTGSPHEGANPHDMNFLEENYRLEEKEGARIKRKKVDLENEYEKLRYQDQKIHIKSEYLVQNLKKYNVSETLRQDDDNRPLSCKHVYYRNKNHLDFQPNFRQILPILYVYSAYWDPRPNDFDNKNNITLVRLMTLKEGNSKPVLYCGFKNLQKKVKLKKSAINYGVAKGFTNQSVDDAVEDAVDVIWSPVSVYYEMCENHNMRFGGYILSCQHKNVLHEVNSLSIKFSRRRNNVERVGYWKNADADREGYLMRARFNC